MRRVHAAGVATCGSAAQATTSHARISACSSPPRAALMGLECAVLLISFLSTHTSTGAIVSFWQDSTILVFFSFFFPDTILLPPADLRRLTRRSDGGGGEL